MTHTSPPARTLHLTKLQKVARFPLDPHWLPVCASCGDLNDKPLDMYEAKIVTARHESDVALGRVMES